MPKYDYLCPANGRTIEVQHRMSEEVTTWGELCERAGLETGDTPADSPVEKTFTRASLMAAANVGSDSSGGSSFGAGSTARAYHSTKNF
jgi:predicted nucleic acid-binding Zn ribbon protein